jgi:hypothetical protein
MSADLMPMTFKTPAETKAWLEKLAQQNHRSVAGQINFIIDQAKKSQAKTK